VRRAFRKALNHEFERELGRRLGGVQRARLETPLSGSSAWVIGSNENVSAYVILAVSPRDDTFTIELAWSSTGKIPESVEGVPSREVQMTDFRLSRLWQPTGFEVWYDLASDLDFPDSSLEFDPTRSLDGEEPSAERISLKVGRALDSLEEHGIPHMRSVIKLP
jgi:hypothetical protein